MEQIIVSDPGIFSGEPVFRGTRIPFKILTDYLEGGDGLEAFLDQYPTIRREDAITALEQTHSPLTSKISKTNFCSMNVVLKN
ncbi:MAG TPA: DUF433 domain-containing protein [Candidatus Angelobacter sp.]|nr:DUF433 domain-containing protein [Candidatus Angelobacter sp.]